MRSTSTDPADTTPEQETAIARSVVYSCLSRLLAYPSPQHNSYIEEMLAPVLQDLQLPHEVRSPLRVVLAEHSASLDELRRAHTLLFPPIESQDYPGYETAYSAADVFRQTHTMADVAGFYRAHGLQVGGTERERPDHITTELEFMAFMAAKEAWAFAHLGSDETGECRRTQELFLSEHLGRWGVSLGLRISVGAGHSLYRAVGDLLAAWLETDMNALGITPSERYDRPVPQAEPDDGECGPDPAPILAPPTIRKV